MTRWHGNSIYDEEFSPSWNMHFRTRLNYLHLQDFYPPYLHLGKSRATLSFTWCTQKLMMSHKDYTNRRNRTYTYNWSKVLIDRCEIFKTSLNFAAIMKKCSSKKKNRRNRENNEVYLFYFETLRLEIWHALVKTFSVLWNLGTTHITHTFRYFIRLKRVGSVLSR